MNKLILFFILLLISSSCAPTSEKYWEGKDCLFHKNAHKKKCKDYWSKELSEEKQTRSKTALELAKNRQEKENKMKQTLNIEYNKDLIPNYFYYTEVPYKEIDKNIYEAFYKGPKKNASEQFKHALSLTKQSHYQPAMKAYQDFLIYFSDDKRVPKVLMYYARLGEYIYFDTFEVNKIYNEIFTTHQKNMHWGIFGSGYGLDLLEAEQAYIMYLYNLYKMILEPDDYNYCKDCKNLTKIQKEIVKKEFCDEFLTTDPFRVNLIQRKTKRPDFVDKVLKLYYLKNSYETAKCSITHGSLNENSENLYNKDKSHVGFNVNLIENDSSLNMYFDQYEINFDFNSLKVDQLILPKNKKNVIKRSYEIVEISDQQIFMQETFRDFKKFCQSVNIQNKGLKIFDAISINEECSTQIANFNKFHLKDGLIPSTPYLYLKFNLNNSNLERTYWPLEKKSNRKKYGKLFTEDILKYKKTEIKIDKEKVIETLFWAATIYLFYNNLTDIKDIASNSKNNSISKSFEPSKSYSNDFAKRSIQQKYKILKYYGYFR